MVLFYAFTTATFDFLLSILNMTVCQAELEKIKAQRGYVNQDEIECAPDKLPDYETALKNFFIE